MRVAAPDSVLHDVDVDRDRIRMIVPQLHAETGSAVGQANRVWRTVRGTMNEAALRLGAFSVSLTVRDLAASRAFYEKLGFSVFHGQAEQGWLILRNETATIGLFQGMFERNILTFNPGWDADAKAIGDFTDVRELQRELGARGVGFESKADEGSEGPASFVVIDPDGNPILVDQHV